jgi:hypothetical protein
MRLATLVLFGLIPTVIHAQEQPVSLERTLVRAAPAVIKHCQEKGYQNVGVLKFLTLKEGQKNFSDNAGTLNRTVAKQLEMGLILSNDARKTVGIIEDASSIAAKTPGANHLTKEGRAKLFEPKYPLAWGKETVTADAFVTGTIGVSADLKTLKIQLFVFDKATNSLGLVGKELIAANDPRKLSEMGESFTRGAFDDGSVETKAERTKQEEKSLEKAAEVKEQKVKNPAQDSASPVKLEVLYNGKPVPVEFKDGKAFIPEPNVGQKVTLKLTRTGDKGIFGCVVKVNGENTLFREKFPDANCRKWLLFPETKDPVEIVGFQKDETTSEEFRVLSKAESKAREIDYGADVGTITLTVFPELKGQPPRGDLTEETQSTKVLEKAQTPEKKPDNFNALTAQLLEDANRGLIAEGNKVGSKIEIVKFTADPSPIMSLTIVYYKKQ